MLKFGERVVVGLFVSRSLAVVWVVVSLAAAALKGFVFCSGLVEI